MTEEVATSIWLNSIPSDKLCAAIGEISCNPKTDIQLTFCGENTNFVDVTKAYLAIIYGYDLRLRNTYTLRYRSTNNTSIL